MKTSVIVILALFVFGTISGNYEQKPNNGVIGGASINSAGLLNQLNSLSGSSSSGSSSFSSSSTIGSIQSSSRLIGSNIATASKIADGKLQPLFFTTSGSSSSSSSTSSSNQLSGAQLQAQLAKLPGNSKIDQMIGDADIVSITKTVQLVISLRIDCNIKIDYLSNLLGRIRSAISMKQFNIEQIRRFLADIREEITRLNVEIQSLLSRQADIGLVTRRANLASALARLEAAYTAYNDANNGNTDLTVKINDFNRQITISTQKIDNIRRLNTLDQQTISQIDQTIAGLQRQITQAQERKNIITVRIENNNNLIEQINRNITTIRTSIREVEVQIRTAEQNLDRLENSFQVIELEVDQIKSDISRLQSRQVDLNNQIIKLRLEVQSKTAQLDDSQIARIETMIKTLNNALPSIENQIDALVLRCSGFTESETAININASEISGGIVYRVNPDEFLRYLQNNYGVSVSRNTGAISNLNTNIQGGASGSSLDLLLTNIFSPVWQRSFGSPFSNDPYFQTGTSSGFQYTSDGSCSARSTSDLSSNYGSIQSISGNVIKALGNDGRNYDLNLGACTRIQMPNRGLPAAGNQIYWKGTQNANNNYSVQSCTMW